MPITIYSNQVSSENISFEVFVASEGMTFTVPETATFNQSLNLGTVSSPFILTIDVCDEILILKPTDIPFRNFYKAGTEIRFEGNFPLTTNNLTLYAPSVIVSPGSKVLGSGPLNVINEGCN